MNNSSDPQAYVGRFAPSPTGDLHFGSLVAAVASYLQAKRNAGRWLVRIEDIDPPREIEGSAQQFVHELGRLGMSPDRPVLYQSAHFEKFHEVCHSLLLAGLAYQCSCSRKSIPASGVYPGTCRHGVKQGAKTLSTRIRVKDEAIEFIDGLQGLIRENLSQTSGDFVIWRADNLPAYQLAVVVDDAFQNVTEVVRGADLLDSTARQIHLQRTLGLATPAYVHLPVATIDGQKLSKRLGSDPLSSLGPARAVRKALEFLGQCPPESLNLDGLWAWAIEHWDIKSVPAMKSINIQAVNGI